MPVSGVPQVERASFPDPSPVITPYQILRPFLWLAAMGFLIGFTGFLLLGRGAFASDAPQFEPGRAAPVGLETFVAPNPVRAA